MDLSCEKLAKTVIITAVNDFIDYAEHKNTALREIGINAKQFLFAKEPVWINSRHTWLERAGYDPEWFEERLNKAYPQYVRARGRGKPNNPKALITLTCPTCKNEFKVYRSMHKINPRTHCSRNCKRR